MGKRGKRETLPGRGRGRCEAAAAIEDEDLPSSPDDARGFEALPPLSRPRIGLWLGSPAGASLLSCAMRFALSAVSSIKVESEGES